VKSGSSGASRQGAKIFFTFFPLRLCVKIFFVHLGESICEVRLTWPATTATSASASHLVNERNLALARASCPGERGELVKTAKPGS